MSGLSSGNDRQKYKINPVELAIFSIVTLVFLNSVYKLFYDWKGSASFTQTATVPPENRSLASVTLKPTLESLKIDLENPGDVKTLAAKIRLSGPLLLQNRTLQDLVRTEIKNETTQTVATVFTDPSTSSFSTDYLPLADGQNQVSFRFVYQGGRAENRKVTIQKLNR